MTSYVFTGATDYGCTDGQLSFSAGQPTRMVTVSLSNDNLVEPDETFNIVLSDPVSRPDLTISPATAIVTITDTDGKFSACRNPDGRAG